MNNHKQQGVTFITLVFIFVIFAFFLLTGLKLFPGYNEFFSVKSAMNGLAEEENISRMTRKQMWGSLYKRFDINSVTTPTYDDLYVEYNKETKMREISMFYEVRVPMFGNVDAVMVFDAPIEVPAD
ncbi:MAG: DUF4845 domain-containing protein [Immundisolibacteraceae bacterium]|nr:DUF4845 domain-containing protein [Immundisolibacteraceae bacterium]